MQVQNTTRLCIVRDLTEHDVVSRIMRKENYLIGMLNKGVLALHVGTPCLGLRKKFMLTKTLEWNLHWCLLDCMFGEDFRLKPAFLQDAPALQRRFRSALHVKCVAGLQGRGGGKGQRVFSFGVYIAVSPSNEGRQPCGKCLLCNLCIDQA